MAYKMSFPLVLFHHNKFLGTLSVFCESVCVPTKCSETTVWLASLSVLVLTEILISLFRYALSPLFSSPLCIFID